jgi:lipopolysaccharide biosynthesis protein
MTKQLQTNRVIAFYLPQFHPIPENDEWWGRGFTEWFNVAKARPQFKDHYQPHLPGDLGFYDLRLPETRRAQADLARNHGIDGFCYYHYWFNGRRILHRPFDEVLKSGQPDLPFCLCWANEDWTRAWDGRSGNVLLKQDYNWADDLAHIAWLTRVFQDPRYLRYDGKPIFLVYRAGNLPEPIKTTELWRQEARRLGVGELFLCRVESLIRERNVDPQSQGFDAAVDFQPDWSSLGPPRRSSWLWKGLQCLGLSERVYLEHNVYDYQQVVERMLIRPSLPYMRFPCVTPGWDNSARRIRDAVILKDSSPAIFERWLRAALEQSPTAKAGNLLFVNAWNEWAEGAHLEPCRRWGHAYLEAVKNVTGSGVSGKSYEA